MNPLVVIAGTLLLTTAAIESVKGHFAGFLTNLLFGLGLVAVGANA